MTYFSRFTLQTRLHWTRSDSHDFHQTDVMGMRDEGFRVEKLAMYFILAGVLMRCIINRPMPRCATDENADQNDIRVESC